MFLVSLLLKFVESLLRTLCSPFGLWTPQRNGSLTAAFPRTVQGSLPSVVPSLRITCTLFQLTQQKTSETVTDVNCFLSRVFSSHPPSQWTPLDPLCTCWCVGTATKQRRCRRSHAKQPADIVTFCWFDFVVLQAATDLNSSDNQGSVPLK